MKKTKASLGATLVVLSSFFYASYGIWTKLMGNFFGGYTASALRSVLVLAILIPIVVVSRKWEPINWQKSWMHILGLVFFSFFIWGPLYYAILNAGVGLALTVAYASIVISMFFFGWLFANERFTKDKWVSAILGLIGIALIFSPSTSHVAWLALGAALLSGTSTGALTVIIKLIPYQATQATVISWTISVFANLVMAFLIKEKVPQFGFHIQWLYLVLFAIASTIASWSLSRGVKLLEAGSAGVLGLLEIVFGVAFGIVFFHERPGMVAVAGVVVIIAASAIPYIKDLSVMRGTLN